MYYGPMVLRKSHRSFFRRYTNAVTGSTRADAPPLCLGGLLADVGSFSIMLRLPCFMSGQAYTSKGYGIGQTIDDTGLDHEVH